MNAKKIIGEVLEKAGKIDQVYWVACGGSLVDLYPGHCFLNAESSTIYSSWYTSKEFVLSTPKKLGKNSLAIVCSHSGNTPETVEAAHLAKSRGAEVITLTDKAGSACDHPDFITWVYPWGSDVSVSETPGCITLSLVAELLLAQEGFDKYNLIMDGVSKMDAVIAGAVAKVNEGRTREFADVYGDEPFFYIMGSGPSFSQTYGFSICSMMEMQWKNCSYIHSGEYFHGPFECTEDGVLYILQMSAGKSRNMDERALAFLREHTDKIVVIDALELGIGAVDSAVADYFCPILFYAMNCEYREALAQKFHHPVDTRRYMGILEY